MTIPTQSSEATYIGNGVTTLFTFPFVADQASDIEVLYTDSSGVLTLLNPSVYTLVINAPPLGGLWGIGGSVTYPTAGIPIQVGTSVTIRRAVPFVQDVTISNQGAFYPQVVEQALDILELQIQQVRDRTGQYRGVWQTNTQYFYGDTVQDGINGNNTGSIFLCTITNLSGIWSSDLAAGDWVFGLGIGVPTQYQTEFYTSNPLYPTPMDADAAATAAGGSLVVDSPYTFIADQTFNAPIVRFASTAKWTRSTHTITFRGQIFAPEVPLFDTAVTPIVFSKLQGTIYSRWFGVIADDTLNYLASTANLSATDDTIAYKACLESAALMASGVEIVIPTGFSKITQPLICVSPITSNQVLRGIIIRGRGRYNSGLQSWLTSGTMLTIGVTTIEASGGSNGYGLDSICFSSNGTEDILVNVNFCRTISMKRFAFLGGNNLQCYLGRTQDYFVEDFLFGGRAVRDPITNILTYFTPFGVRLATDSNGQPAGPSFFRNGLIRDFRNSTHTGCGFQILAGGGHRISNIEMGNSDISLDDEVNGNLSYANRYESSGIFFTYAPNGGNTGNGVVTYPAGQMQTGTSGVVGNYIFTFTGPTTATVTDAVGDSLPNMTVGTTYTAGQNISLLFTAGSNPWVSGDIITVTAAGDILELVGNINQISDHQSIMNRYSGDSVVNQPCIKIVSYGSTTINSCFFTSALGVVVYLGAGNGNPCLFTENIGINCRTQISDSSIDGKWLYRDNLEPTPAPFVDNAPNGATTPSVRNLKTLHTANTVPTTITNFAGGYNGQTFTLSIADNNTTIVNGSSINLINGQNGTFRAGDTTVFMAYNGTSASAPPVWNQIFIGGETLVTASTGTMTIKSGSANNANNAGFIELGPNMFIPYFTTAKP